MTKSDRSRNRAPLFVLVGVAVAITVALVALWPRIERAMSPTADRDAAPAIGGPFSLVDQDGRPVTETSWGPVYRLIYFGYTFCPDACPTELQVMGQAMDDLGADAAKVQPIFITIDPARDTPKQLASYVPQFHPRLVGLTGTPQQIAAIARAYKVYYLKAGDGESYAMDHSSLVYLMDPAGKFLTVFSSDVAADTMAAEIRRYMSR